MYLIRRKIKALAELKISFAFSEKNYLKIPAFKFFPCHYMKQYLVLNVLFYLKTYFPDVLHVTALLF